MEMCSEENISVCVERGGGLTLKAIESWRLPKKIAHLRLWEKGRIPFRERKKKRGTARPLKRESLMGKKKGSWISRKKKHALNFSGRGEGGTAAKGWSSSI